MNANSNSVPPSYSEQLAAFENRLGSHIDDEKMLHDIHAAIKTLLTGNGDSEADIRKILRTRLTAGNLREESFQLVQKMLDRIVSEQVDTMSDQQPDNDPFIDTTVIPDDSLDSNADTSRLQTGSVLRDRFLLQEKVAGGSMGDVYKALDRRLAETNGVEPWVAIKVLTPKLARNGNALRALQQEAAKGRCLSHPNIVRFIDLDREDDTYFIVMEWLEGRSLASILDSSSGKKIDLETTLDIVRQISKALDYAHLCGVVHADVKPGNIMITPQGKAKLFDFGVARIRQKEHDGDSDFDPGVLHAKTQAYSSMQVLTGEEPVAVDDVFSLGCLMYRLVAGYRVFGPRNAAEAVAEGMEPQRPQGLSQAQWSALRKALSYSRVARFASPGKFLAALNLDRRSPAIADDGIIEEEEQERRSPWRFVALVLILGGLVAVVIESRIIERLHLDEVPGAPPVTLPAAEPRPVPEATDDQRDPQDEGPAAELLQIDSDNQAVEAALTVTDADLPVDFSSLPPADLVVTLASGDSPPSESRLTLREESPPAIIDLVRDDDLATPLTVRLAEVSYSGNRSPWESGQYRIADDGIVEFSPGQNRARTTIAMQSDPLREPDRQVSLLVRDLDTAESEFALIILNLEDDDQRKFEAGLRPNTVAFAVSQVSVRERDPAVQIDVLRFKPDDTSLEVEYTIRDVTAKEGEDYFAPGATTIYFQPGQRTARVLIPLVQDSDPESDEAFMLELVSDSPETDPNIFLRIAVMIRDDDS
jgi:serine/threonine protein kinase